MFRLVGALIKGFVKLLLLPIKLVAAVWRFARWMRLSIKLGAVFLAAGLGVAWGLKQAVLGQRSRARLTSQR